MKRRHWLILVQAFVAVVVLLAFPSSALAQTKRTWVSGVGDDVNPCSRTAPCRTFAGAVAKTAADGEVDVLDPGGYGTANITKGMTIDGSKALAAINNTGVAGININAPGQTVTLRGLSIAGGGAGATGINIIAAATVNIEDCVISGQDNGIVVVTNAILHLHVRNTIVRKSINAGLSSTTASGVVVGTIVSSSFTGNGVGVHAKLNTKLSALLSNFSDNNTSGVTADSNCAVSLKSSLVANNPTGLQTNAGGIVRLNDSDVLHNTSGVAFAGGVMTTSGNNRFSGNTSNFTGGAPAPAEPQQ